MALSVMNNLAVFDHSDESTNTLSDRAAKARGSLGEIPVSASCQWIAITDDE